MRAMEGRNFNDWLKQEGAGINLALDEELRGLPEPARAPAGHLLMAGGKRLRPILTLLFARLFGNEDPLLRRLACAMEMLHAATLLHDDVLDSAESRRGKPSAHKVFGAAAAILGGDALLARANSITASFRNPDLVDCFSEATVMTASGEILEMSSLRDPRMDLEKYIEIARGKTACLIAQSCRMGALAAGAPEKLAQKSAAFGENLGVAFQIVDDVLDFAPEERTGKPRGGDLREGKMTPPIHFYRQSLDEAGRADFDRRFAAGDQDPAWLEAVCAACASFSAPALALADSFMEKAAEALRALPDNAYKARLESVMSYARGRGN